MNPFLHVVAEANERWLYSQAKWFSNNFFIYCVGIAKNCFAGVNIHQFPLIAAKSPDFAAD